MNPKHNRVSQKALLDVVGHAVALEQERLEQIDPSQLDQISGGDEPTNGTTMGYFPTGGDTTSGSPAK